MANANLTMGVKGIDKTGAAFTSIRNRAKATGASIRSIMGGAIAAAGAYLSFRTIKSSIDELGQLSDIAAAAKTNVGDLRNAVIGLQVVGINTSIEELSRALVMMRKNTGREGMGGFYELVKKIGEIPDAAERSKVAMAVFGRSGLVFMPMIDAARDGVAAVKGVADVLPKVPEAAAKAGDEASDAMRMAGEGIHAIWLQAIGKLVGWFGSFFPGGIRGAVATAINYVDYGLKMAFISVQRTLYQIHNYTVGYIEKAGAGIGAALGTWFGGGGFMEGFENFGNEWEAEERKQQEAIRELDRVNTERARRWEEEFADRKQKIEELGKGLGTLPEGKGNGANTGEAIGNAAVRAVRRITNQLMLGGSSSAQRLALLGPEYQNESKKQTSLLKEIAANTKKAADSEGDTLTVTDLGT